MIRHSLWYLNLFWIACLLTGLVVVRYEWRWPWKGLGNTTESFLWLTDTSDTATLEMRCEDDHFLMQDVTNNQSLESVEQLRTRTPSAYDGSCALYRCFEDEQWTRWVACE
jgi:hypothetical protein